MIVFVLILILVLVLVLVLILVLLVLLVKLLVRCCSLYTLSDINLRTSADRYKIITEHGKIYSIQHIS